MTAPVVGDTKNLYGRAYVFTNPNSNIGPGTWVLSTRDLVPADAGDDINIISGSAVLDATSASVLRGQVVSFTGTGTLKAAQADTLGNAEVVGMAIGGANPNQTCSFTSDGDVTFTNIATVTDEGNATLSVGSRYYLSATNPGNITTSVDTTTTGSVVVYVGRAIAADRIALEISVPVVI